MFIKISIKMTYPYPGKRDINHQQFSNIFTYGWIDFDAGIIDEFIVFSECVLLTSCLGYLQGQSIEEIILDIQHGRLSADGEIWYPLSIGMG